MNALPTGTVSGSASICAGGCTPIQAALTGTPPWDVRWSDGYEQNGVETSPATRSVCPISTTTYSVSNVTDGNRCSNTGTDSAVITVDVAPSIQSHPRSVAVCGGGRAVFCVIASGSLPLSYQWRKYGNPIPGATADCLTIDPVTFGDRGDYDVIVINHCGREISRFANLAVSLLFASPVPYVAGVSPVALTLADFSVPPDGAPDVAAANRDSNDLTVRWNDGQGRFGAAPTTVTLFSGDQPSALAAGDFVPGGGRDIVVACPGANVVKVISNTGVFSFVAPLPLPAGTSQPSALAVGDFDGQSTDDVAVALAGTGTAAAGVAVILNSGQATLLADGSFSGPRQDVVAADLDGDGDLDLAVTVSAASSPRVLLYQNIGPRSGNFILAGALTAPGTPYALCARDLDGNGRMDLAVTVESSSLPEQGGVILFLHDSKPGMSPDNFSATSIFTGPSLPGRIAAADLARNSIPGFVSLEDLVTANRASGDISEWFGFYGPAFQAVVHCPAGAEPVAVGLADLNRDARPDIVVANRVSQDVSVFLHNPLALAQVFGAGCPGTGGRTPQVSTVGVPNLGNTAFALQVDDARPNSSAYLLISGGLSPFNIGGGCWIYPDLGGTLMGLFTNETGSAVLPVPLPPSPSPLNGLDLYVQWAIVDPEGAYGNVLAFSAGLRIMLGQPF